MKTITLTIVTAALVLICDPVSAQTARGMGGTPCSQWNNGREWNAKVQWVLGFVSGEESYAKPQSTSTTNISDDAIIRAITTWCKARPSSDVAEAALATELSWTLRGGPTRARHVKE
jgi:hypothetical protein